MILTTLSALVFVTVLYIWDTLKSQALLGKYTQITSDQQKEIIQLKHQLEVLRNTNKLLSMEFDDAKKETEKLREFNTILQIEYNKEKKK